ncbi:MAG: ABC transporter permease [Clostridia bacterium]|nr:ABC transporter permease [Clostridia bacterium]
MNVFAKVTWESLKKNRTRTIVTIIGIMLSAAMICASTTFVSSMQNFILRCEIYNVGDWHGAIYDAAYKDYEDIRASGKVASSTYAQVLGYAKIDSANERKPYLYVLGGDLASGYFDTMPVHLLSGTLPKNSSEILLPEHLSTNGKVNYKVGDTVTLAVGDRTLDGRKLGQSNPCFTYDETLFVEVKNNETIENVQTRTYTVVGIYERPTFESWDAPGYTALTVADKGSDSRLPLHCYFKMKNPSAVYDLMQEMGYRGAYANAFNTKVLLYSGVSSFSSVRASFYSLAAILIGLIMFGSISLIYNAFSISVSERTRQFGLLASVGATKKQLRRMVLFEALTVSAIGIPLGILVGIGGIGITLFLIGDKFSSLIRADIPMRICVSWEAVVIAAVIALITVLISAWIPSKRATKVSAVEAIRQTKDIKAGSKPVKTSKLTYKLFGLPGVMAGKHYKRNRKKYRTTVGSLFMSIVLFVSAAAFTDYLTESAEGGLGVERFDLVYATETDVPDAPTSEKVLNLLFSDKNVTGGTYVKKQFLQGDIDRKYVTDTYVNRFAYFDSDPDSDKLGISGYIHFVADAEFNKLLKKYNLKEADYYNRESPLGLALDNNLQLDRLAGKYVTLDTLRGNGCVIEGFYYVEIEGYRRIENRIDENGKEIVIYQKEGNEKDILEVPYEESFGHYSLRSEKTIEEAPFFISRNTPAAIHMIYPYSMLESVIPKPAQNQFRQANFLLTSDDHARSFDNLATVLEENGLRLREFYDYAADAEDERNIVTIIRVFAYGFIVLISLIAAANVFNTISTNIHLRRREFAMLKSVGMTQKGFNKMMNYECLLYGSKALLLGLPVSCGITYLIYRAVGKTYETTFHLPWAAIGIAVLSVFLVVFATMMYSMSKIKKDNPIDALKNENL